MSFETTEAALLSLNNISHPALNSTFLSNQTLQSLLNPTLHNHSAVHSCSSTADVCSDGIFLPPWLPQATSASEIFYRAVVYLTAMIYVLFGVNIISDRVSSAVEVIMAQRRRKTVKNKRGEVSTIEVPIWHPVVGHLTVYVIGSSAPEIFLPLIEVTRRQFELDELGPSLILGSGAYHLFLITGVCIWSVRENFAKPIREQGVFFISAAFAIFAYLWLYLISKQISPDIIEVWEAVLTLCFFPIIVFSAWCAEKRIHRTIYKKLMRFIVAPAAGDPRHQQQHHGEEFADFSGNVAEGERRRRLAALLKELKQLYPNKTKMELEEMAELNLLESAPKGAAYYRMQASKAMSGSGAVISKEKIKKRLEHEQKRASVLEMKFVNPNAQFITFEPAQYTVMESVGDALLTVVRSGCGVDRTALTLSYRTLEGSAKFVDDFVEKSGQLEFEPEQTTADIFVTIIDDDEFEEDKEFYVEIYDPVLKPKRASKAPSSMLNNKPLSQQAMTAGKNAHLNGVNGLHSHYHSNGHSLSPNVDENAPVVAELKTSKVTVKILDDDHCGVFHFESPDVAFPDNIGTAKIKIIRSTGARGRIELPFKVTSGSATAGEDFIVPDESVIAFENDQFEATLSIKIVDKNRIGEMFSFYIELGQPQILSKPPLNSDGNPVLGDPRKLRVGICEDVELNAALDRLLKVADIADLISSTTWIDQFKEAVSYSIGDDDPPPPPEPSLAVNSFVGASEAQFMVAVSYKTMQNRIKHFFNLAKRNFIYVISLPWKLLAASIPPAKYLHGWLAFVLLLALMAFLSSIIGDLASHFGCTVGLKDAVTGVTLIPFGMGLSDLFASRHAAMHEMTADAAIGHITGSNAIGVFFGIGMAWTLAAIYHWSHGQQLIMAAGSFGFGVTLYCAFAGCCVLVLMLRRLPPIRGELGGPFVIKYLSAAFFVALWLTFVTLIALESYCVIKGF